jgi:hypothetical protein
MFENEVFIFVVGVRRIEQLFASSQSLLTERSSIAENERIQSLLTVHPSAVMKRRRRTRERSSIAESE